MEVDPHAPTSVGTQHAESVAATQRLRFTWTQTMDVDVDPEEAASLLDSSDMLDVSDAATRYRRQAHHDYEFIEHDLAVEAVDDALPLWGYKVLHGGSGQEGYLWSARHFIIQARNELSSGRYREGHCPDLDAVNRDLAAIEDRLREMAWAVDHPPALIDGPKPMPWPNDCEAANCDCAEQQAEHNDGSDDA